jgi:hypothetical protein
MLALLIGLAACGPAPIPSPVPAASFPTPAASSPTPAPTPASVPTPTPATARAIFSFDVENDSSVPVIVSVATDAAATLPGFLPGQRGTISLDMIDPSNGLAVEIQRHPCILLAEDTYLAPEPFTLLIQDGPNPGSIELGTRPGVVQPSMPLPSNDLIGCGG